MPDALKEVLTANARFYKALERGDLELMKEVWFKDEVAKCVHPGWPMLSGWDSIKESWSTIFNGGGPAKIELSDIHTEVIEDVAWITCIERITQKVGEDFQMGLAQATNIFERRGSKWLLVLHHASPVPMRMKDVAEEKLQ
jgi:hypothetical protein